MGLVAIGALIYGGMFTYYLRANARRAAGKEDYKMEGKSEAELTAMGDDSPRFVYVT